MGLKFKVKNKLQFVLFLEYRISPLILLLIQEIQKIYEIHKSTKFTTKSHENYYLNNVYKVKY